METVTNVTNWNNYKKFVMWFLFTWYTVHCAHKLVKNKISNGSINGLVYAQENLKLWVSHWRHWMWKLTGLDEIMKTWYLIQNQNCNTSNFEFACAIHVVCVYTNAKQNTTTKLKRQKWPATRYEEQRVHEKVSTDIRSVTWWFKNLKKNLLPGSFCHLACIWNHL